MQNALDIVRNLPTDLAIPILQQLSPEKLVESAVKDKKLLSLIFSFQQLYDPLLKSRSAIRSLMEILSKLTPREALELLQISSFWYELIEQERGPALQLMLGIYASLDPDIPLSLLVTPLREIHRHLIQLFEEKLHEAAVVSSDLRP
jgi:hypothetical protein